ncbi:MAG: SLC13 family permease, partial [Granulosicoccaceae bacterium]
MEVLFLVLLLLLLALALGSGYPVAFALPGSAIISIAVAAGVGYVLTGNPDAYFMHGGPSQWLSAGVTNLRGVYWEVERDTLIAIPLFIFMGIMLQRSKIAEDLLMTMAQLFGPVPGGLGISVVFVGALLAATTGIVGATVVAMGLISLPVMLRNNYSPALATGTIAASGTLGQIIPPSIVLIILADQLASASDQASSLRKTLYKESTGEFSMPSSFDVISTSAGEMFLGALIPGLVLVGLYMLYILVFALIKPSLAPAVRISAEENENLLRKVLLTLAPPLLLIFLVLGSIITGVATVNQAGAIGAAGALLMAGYRLTSGKLTYAPAILALVALITIAILLNNVDLNIRSISTDSERLGLQVALVAVALLVIALLWSGYRVYKQDNTLNEVMIETAKTTSLVFIILMGAAILTAAFRAFGGEELVRDFLNGLPGGFWTKFIIVMTVIFVLGFFLDFIEIAVVVVPIVAPILLADPGANVTAVWLGVMIGLNVQTSFLTPPFGFALFYLRGVAPAAVKTIQMYKGVIAFILLQIGALVIVGKFPALVNYLPNRMSLTSETAPPPRNPQLQYCIEEYTGLQFQQEGEALMASIASAQSLPLEILPKKQQKELRDSFDDAGNSINLLQEAFDAEATVFAASDDYRPIHQLVRGIEADIRKLNAEKSELETAISREDEEAKRTKLEERVTALDSEITNLQSNIPDDWEERRKAFAQLQAAEDKARATYRRSADNGYNPTVDLLALLDDSEALAQMSVALDDIKSLVTQSEPKVGSEALKVLSKEFSAIEGSSKIKSALGKARKQLKNRKPNKEKALAELDKARALFDEEVSWRQAASQQLAEPLRAYEEAIRSSIGTRSQRRLTREQALHVA